jgi:hypothetical protein
MDGESFELLQKMKLDNMVLIRVDDIITEELVEVQKRTTKGQFCWICQPIICQYILKTFNAEIVIYLEADSLFFADPEILLQELGDNSVSIVPHNFSPEFDNTEVAGEYCVQFNAFRNDEFSHKVLDYWKLNCFKYTNQDLIYVPGQTCLDNWSSLFTGVKVIINQGAGVAPWNINKYKLSINNNVLYVNDAKIVFYHFHQYGRYKDGAHELGSYPYSNEVIQFIYGKYINEIKAVERIVHQTDPNFNFRRVYQRYTLKDLSLPNIKPIFEMYLIILKRRIRKRYNVFPATYFNYK